MPNRLTFKGCNFFYAHKYHNMMFLLPYMACVIIIIIVALNMIIIFRVPINCHSKGVL